MDQRRTVFLVAFMRGAVKAATFEHREMREPSVIFPVLEKITVNGHMSARRPVTVDFLCV